MVTMVGQESTLDSLVSNLLSLEHDAIAAYDGAIERFESSAFKDQVAAFKGDHERHIAELNKIAGSIGMTDTPKTGDSKQLLTTGKVAMAGLMGDKAILKAMKTNEDDTVTAYERASSHDEATAEARPVFERALEDERRHRAWMEETAERL